LPSDRRDDLGLLCAIVETIARFCDTSERTQPIHQIGG
jgi:hypothetical protein